MARQRTINGRPVTFRLPPRRFLLVFAFAIFIIALIIFATPSSVRQRVPKVPYVAELSEKATEFLPKPKLPKLYNPFGEDVHEPPQQSDSAHGETRWYNDWKWQNPFSSLITLDEDRAVLPPLKERTPVYTFYEKNEKDSKVSAAENKLLLTWRRAWWAQGFKPVVLGKAEAVKHPLHQRAQHLKLEPAVAKELERWLAWGHMRGGILVNWLLLPMGSYDEAMLTSLRRGQFEKLTTYKDLKHSIYCGMENQINDAITHIVEAEDAVSAATLAEILPPKSLDTQGRHPSLAFYDKGTIDSKYTKVSEALDKDRPAGLESLQKLINSHLHTTWQNSFSSGVAVLKPHPEHMTSLSQFALRIAQLLVQCPDTPIPTSCPPNRACTACSPSHLTPIITLDTLAKESTSFTIGTAVHPVTFTSLYHLRAELDTPFIRRNTTRDLWLAGVTDKLLGSDIGGPQRLTKFKEAVAGVPGVARALWITAEREEPLELEWVFGFTMSSAIDETHDLRTDTVAVDSDAVAQEKVLLETATQTVKSKHKKERATRDMVEAWSMADAEAWRFVRAYGMRRKVERLQWEDGEKKFAGAEKGRWFD